MTLEQQLVDSLLACKKQLDEQPADRYLEGCRDAIICVIQMVRDHEGRDNSH